MKRAIILLFGFSAACGSVGSSGSTADDPTIASISPDHGPILGGITVTITGTGFSAGTPVVVVGGTLAQNATAASDTQITFDLPPGEEGAIVDVTVGNDRGFGTIAGAFTYNPRPIILTVEPSLGRGGGGTQITIVGRGFQQLEAGVPMIDIGGGIATNVQIIDDQTITAITGAVTDAKPFIPLDVILTNANGTTMLPKSFTTTKRGLIGIARFSGAMHFIDRTTGELTPLGIVNRQVNGCATSGGVMFGISRNSQFTGRDLFKFDPLVGTIRDVVPIAAGAQFPGINSITFAGDKLIGLNVSNNTTNVSPATNRLVEINRDTGAATFLGQAPMPVEPQSPGAIGPLNGTSVYFADVSNQTFDTITVSTSILNPGPTMVGGNATRIHGLANVDGTVYVLEQSGSRLFTINPTTGALTLITNLSTNINTICETPSTF